MKVLAVVAFLAGLLLAVRVMFFGVQRRVVGERGRLSHRRWPLALAAFLMAGGALLYARSAVTGSWVTAVVVIGVIAGAGAWWVVHRSAAVPSSDPHDDPKFRFQGHVARITEAIEARSDGTSRGRIAFDFDGERHEMRARWTSGDWEGDTKLGNAGREVVIERTEDDVAYVEPWTVVELRL